VAGQWETEAARERERNLPEVSAAGISDTIARAERLARLGRLDARSAREIINDVLAAAGHEGIPAVTNREWCEIWRKSKAGAVKPCSQLKYEQVCRDWLSFLGRKAEKPVDVISKAEAVAFRDSRAKAGLSPRTVNEAVKLVRGIYGEAVEQGTLGLNPFAGVDRLRDESDSAKKLPFTVEEVSRLVKHAEGDWRGLVILAATTGLRLMDGAGLRWRDLDLEEGVIRVHTSKTGAFLNLPIHPSFSEWLEGQTRGIGAAPVFPKLVGKRGSGNNGLSGAFKRLMARAQIDAGTVMKPNGAGKEGRCKSRKSYHSLRHFAVSQMAAAGVRGEVARQITGHADLEVHARYVTPDLATLRGAVNAIQIAG
jgi:integrase